MLNICDEIVLRFIGKEASAECPVDAIVKSVGRMMGVTVQDNDISVANPIPTYKDDSPPKLVVKFTRRVVSNKLYSSKRKLAGKKAKDLPNLNLSSEANVYISESLTPVKKKLVGEVNKVKKKG